MQFGQTRRKNFAENSKFFSSQTETNLIFFQKKYFSPKGFSGDAECSFDSPADKLRKRRGFWKELRYKDDY